MSESWGWLKDPFTISLLSGLIGSLIGSTIGVFGAFGLYWFDRCETSRRALNDYLTALLDDVHWKGDPANIYKTWEGSLGELRHLQSAAISFSFGSQRGRMRKAWEEYKGKHQDVDIEKEAAKAGIILTYKQGPQTKDEFKNRIYNFLLAIKGVP